MSYSPESWPFFKVHKTRHGKKPVPREREMIYISCKYWVAVVTEPVVEVKMKHRSAI